MNPKIALFLSATLTAFVVATLSGVVNKVANAPAENAVAPVAVVTEQTATATLEQPTEVPTPTVQAPLGPEEAAALAAEAIGQQDVYSVETSTYNDVEAYKVVFSSGDIVYIGLDSQVLAKTKLQPVVVNVEPTKKPSKKNKNNDDNNQSSNNSGGGEHENEHESEHEGGDD